MSTVVKKSGPLKRKQPNATSSAADTESTKPAPEKPKEVDVPLETTDDKKPDEEKPEDNTEPAELSIEKTPLTEAVDKKTDEDVKEKEDEIEYINLDEIDGSDSEEMPSKVSEAFTSMSDRVFDEDVMEYLKALGLKGSPDSLELEILKMPTLDVVTAETKQARESRKILIYPINSTDLSNSTLQRILGMDSCTNFIIKCDRTGDNHAWNGSAVLSFSMASAAASVTTELRQMRRSLHIEQGGTVDSKFAKLQPQLPEKDWTEMMLVVKNIGDSTTEKVLMELFPGADVIIHKDRTGSSGKGHAYLLYGSAERAKEVLEKYSEKKLEVNGRRLILLKWRQTLPKIVPEGMLRIGERRLIMRTLEDARYKVEKSLDKDYQQAKAKFLQELIDTDDGIRKLVGLPMPTYDQLKKLASLRHFGDSESNQILKRLLEPFDKQLKEKDKEKERAKDQERERDPDKERQRNQDFAAKSKLKSGGNEKGQQISKGDNRGNSRSSRTPLLSKGKTLMSSSRSDNVSSRHGPIPLLSTPIVPMNRNSGTGLLGAGPSDQAAISLLLQQQRTAMVQPLMPSQSILNQQPLLQSPGCFNQPASLFSQPGLLGSYPGELVLANNYDDEPCSKIGRYGTMQSIKDDDLFSSSYGDRDQGVHARDYDHGRRAGSRERLESVFEREPRIHYRDEREERLDSRRDRNDDHYFAKDLFGSANRNFEVEQLFLDERSFASRTDNPMSLLGSLGHQDFESKRGDYRRDWSEQRGRYDEREERRLQGRSEDRLSGVEEESSRRQISSSSSAKADPVNLLINLTQLLAEKLQREKEKEQEKRGSGY